MEDAVVANDLYPLRSVRPLGEGYYGSRKDFLHGMTDRDCGSHDLDCGDDNELALCEGWGGPRKRSGMGDSSFMVNSHQGCSMGGSNQPSFRKSVDSCKCEIFHSSFYVEWV